MTPGHSLTITALPLVKRVLPEALSYSQATRNCLLPEEVSSSSRLKSYSQDMCFMECKLRMLYKREECVPWDGLPVGDQGKQLMVSRYMSFICTNPYLYVNRCQSYS